jgi:hypothetical protein
MKFDCKTEPLVVVGCLSVVCGLAALVAGRLLGVGWTMHGCALPIMVLVALVRHSLREDRVS